MKLINALSLILLAACGKPQQSEDNGWKGWEDFQDYTFEEEVIYEGDEPQEVYRVQPKLAGLTRKVHQKEIRLCINDRTKSEARSNMIASVCQRWVDALKPIAKQPLAICKSYVTRSQGCDGWVQVGYYNPAMTQMGATPVVMINFSGWFGSETVTLHEFGHAFGLLDTYAGRGGSCQRGQPDSVMCRAAYKELKPDDIQGIQLIYNSIF